MSLLLLTKYWDGEMFGKLYVRAKINKKLLINDKSYAKFK